MQKIFSPSLNVKQDSSNFEFSGYASVFNIPDSYNDIILPGAFKDSLLNSDCSKIKLLWQHNTKKPIGIFTRLEETVKGLFVAGKIVTSFAKGREVASLLKIGAIDGLSIGFEAEETFYADQFRYIKKAKLWEISVVTFPAHSNARVEIDPKSEQQLLQKMCNLNLSMGNYNREYNRHYS